MGTLWDDSGRPRLPLILWSVACVTLGVGLTLPVVTLRAGLARDTYSVLGGVADLVASDEVLLALIVLGFSVLFPIAKLALLARVLFRSSDAEERTRVVRTLERLGRWSMLDVFVIAILIGAVHLGILSEARGEPGVYVFAAGILLSMVATHAVQRLLPPERVLVAPSGKAERWIGVAALALFSLGLSRPLLLVEKFRFWDHEYSVLGATRRMLAEGELALAAAVLFFVVLLPLARMVGLAWLRWSRSPERIAAPVLELEKWSMLDVFGLALLVVVAKIGSLASVEVRAGAWILLSAAGLSFVDSWRLRREVDWRPRLGSSGQDLQAARLQGGAPED